MRPRPAVGYNRHAMSIDYGEKEREFIESLEADTGRSLDAWMTAIASQNLAHRNDIIDWLRRQGFLFAKASWLERIHHNGGRPVYADASSPRPAVSEPAPTPERPTIAAVAVKPMPPPEPVPAAASTAADLDALLAQAKAYRPLAQYVLREIATAVPSVSFTTHAGFVAMAAPRTFAVLTIGPRELRLGLALEGATAPPPLVKARFPKPGPSVPATITHMVVLTDARQVTDDLLAAIAATAR